MKANSEKAIVVAQAPLVKCRRPECDEIAVCRGLCGSDYRVAHKLVSDGLVEWTDLERHGKVAAPKRTAKVWFLEYAGRKTN